MNTKEAAGVWIELSMKDQCGNFVYENSEMIFVNKKKHEVFEFKLTYDEGEENEIVMPNKIWIPVGSYIVFHKVLGENSNIITKEVSEVEISMETKEVYLEVIRPLYLQDICDIENHVKKVPVKKITKQFDVFKNKTVLQYFFKGELEPQVVAIMN